MEKITEDWWNNLELVEDVYKDMEELEEGVTKELEKLWEETEKRILADPQNMAEIKRFANECNEKEEVVLVFAVLKYWEKAGLFSQQDIKDIIKW